jgi:hypothetical protein
MRLSRIGGAALLALGLCGCGFSASPADGLQFQAPPGWRASPGIMGFMQFWRPPAADNEVLMLIKSPKAISPSDVFSDARMNDSLKNATVEQRQTIQICGHQPAEYVVARGESARHGDERIDTVMTNAGGTTYFAMYVRPVSVTPNPLAEAALRELCVKP